MSKPAFVLLTALCPYF